jgi:hypothetical protein
MRLDSASCARISQMRAGTLVVVFCVSVVLLPAETFGRSGGFGGGFRSFGPGFHPPALRPQARHESEFGGAHRRRFGYGFLPLTGFGYGDYGPGYGSFDYVPPQDQSVPSETTGAISIPGRVPRYFTPYVPYRSGCPSETVTVPSEDGGERSINIMRC